MAVNRKVWGAVAAVVAVGVAAAAAAGFGGADAPPPGATGLPPGTATVLRQTLTQTEQVTGTLGYGAPQTLHASAAAGTVTWLPAPGQIIRLGEPVYQVDGKPVVLIHGSVPPYRTLEPGVKGPDVQQLEEGLKALGYKGFTVDTGYDWATAAAVNDWQAKSGWDKTGRVGRDQIFVAAGDIRVGLLEAAPGARLAGQANFPLYTFSGTGRVVSVALDVAKQHLVKQGTSATITLPDGGKVNGEVSKVDTVASPPAAGAQEKSATIGVTVAIADQAALGSLDGAPVTLSLVAQTRENVLTVPIAALVALTAGGYGVQVVEGSATRYVAVKTGMFAGGRVEVSGEGIAEGVTVGVPSS